MRILGASLWRFSEVLGLIPGGLLTSLIEVLVFRKTYREDGDVILHSKSLMASER